MGNKHNLLAAVSLVALGGAAHADELTAPEVADWTSFYVSAGGGSNYLFSALAVDAIGPDNLDDSGVAQGFGTIELGADYQFNSHFIFGAVGNFDFGGDKDLGSLASMGAPVGAPIAEWKAGNSWGIGARAGFLASPRTLIYGIGGITQLEVSTDKISNCCSWSNDEWTSGYFVGAGVEKLLTDSLTLKLEYRFNSYDEVSATATATGGGPPPMPIPLDITAASTDIDNHAIRATLSWRFGR